MSHMCSIRWRGKDAIRFVESLTVLDIEGLPMGKVVALFLPKWTRAVGPWREGDVWGAGGAFCVYRHQSCTRSPLSPPLSANVGFHVPKSMHRGIPAAARQCLHVGPFPPAKRLTLCVSLSLSCVLGIAFADHQRPRRHYR